MGAAFVQISGENEHEKALGLTRDGQVTYGEHAGTDPSTGRQCRPLTPEMLERLQKYAAGKRPQAIATPNPVFFDPRSGEPIVWYYKDKENIFEIFDLMGFHPDTGEELLPVTKEVAEKWKKQAEEKGRHVPKLIADPDKYVFFDPLNGQARAWFWLGASSRYEFYDSPGFQPQTGDKLQLVTREIVNEWKDTQKNPTTAVIPQRCHCSWCCIWLSSAFDRAVHSEFADPRCIQSRCDPRKLKPDKN